jgi:hypothetical protein
MIWSAITGLLGGLFGTKNNAENLVNTASKVVDVFQGNEQEKTKLNNAFIKNITGLMNSTLPQNLSRRVIGISVTGFYLFWCGVALICYPFWPTYSEFVFKLLKDTVESPFLTIIAFYFLKNIVEGYIKK